jgi:dimethylglycine dehydrogenase
MSGCDNVTTIRVSFSGELGYELYCPTEDHVTLYDAVVEAGEEFGLAHVGSRALGSMRIEKAFSSWGTELSPDYTPFEAGIDFFVRPDGRDFIGRDAFLEMSKKPVKQKLCQLVLEVQDKDCFGGEAIYCDCKLAGYVTSAAYGHYIQKSLALGYIRSEFLESDNIQIDRLGEMLNAKISKSPIYDPPGGKMRS